MKLVVSGARLSCSMGGAPSTLTVLPKARVDGSDRPVADVLTHLPQVNVAPFAMCRSMSNPQVAAATAAANGVLTCVLPAPWLPGAQSIEIDRVMTLTDDNTLDCVASQTQLRLSVTEPGWYINLGGPMMEGWKAHRETVPEGCENLVDRFFWGTLPDWRTLGRTINPALEPHLVRDRLLDPLELP